MTDNQENTKPGKAGKVFKRLFLGIKWLFVVFLTVLLITGIYFQAPWKVLTLIAIFLAAITILPKILRKWFCLSTASVVLVLVIWIFLPDDNNGEWKPYTFDEEIAVLEVKRAIPDDQNAALIYEELLHIYDPNSYYPNNWDDLVKDLDTDKPWKSKDRPELAEWIKSHQQTIDKLMHASLKDRCYFPIQTDTTGLMITTERLNPFKRWAQLLLRAGNNDIGHGRIDDALEKYLTVHKMSKHMYQQNFLIEQLVALSIEALSHSQMIRFAATGEANDEHLNLLEEALRNFEYDWPAVWPMVMDSEKMFLKSFLGHFYEINSKGQTRLNRKPLAVIRRYNKYVSAPGYWQRKAAKSKAIFRWFVMPSLQRTLKLTDESYERYYKMAEPDYDWEKSPEDYKFKIRFDFMALLKTMTSTMEGAFRKIHHLYLRTENQRNGAQIIIALRRYKNKNGRWPENLDQLSDSVPSELLIDPVNGDSFVYKFTLDNFTLYSKGENNIDEDGDKWTEKDNGTKTDDLLIWPPKEKRSKKNRNKDGRS